jgi:uncharacterized protein YbaP (TraB family)
MRAALRACVALLAGALLLAAPAVRAQPAASAAAPCPPSAAAPTAQQMQAGARDARDRGLLWRVRKDGRSSYLYGTIHVGRLEWVFPGRTLAGALREADTLALELDPSDPAVAQGLAAAAGAARPATLPAPLQERLQRQLAAACVPPAAVQGMHPVLQAVTLTLLAGRWDGLDATYAQEMMLVREARTLQRPVVSLETAQSQLAVLLPSDDGETVKLVDETLDQLERGRLRPVLLRLSAAWERGDLAELESYERWCECADTDEERAFMRRLNDERNPALAQRIDALHGQGRRVFAAVGALHMTGAQGLPRLLSERGYVVERIRFER